MTDEIVAFIRSRLAEDEKWAYDAITEEQKHPQNGLPQHKKMTYPYPERLARCVFDGYHGPARVLRGVEAKRRLIAESENAYRQDTAAGLELALRIVAAEWSMHPDYRQEWKP